MDEPSITRENADCAEWVASYFVAKIWCDIAMEMDGEKLRQYERALWKLGMDVSGRQSFRPKLFCQKSDDGKSFKWRVVTRGAFWFPCGIDGYRRLWQTLSCGKIDFSDLSVKAERGEFESLEKIAADVTDLYSRVISEGREETPKLPNKHLGGIFARRWLGRVATLSNMDVMLESYRDGVPVEYIMA